MTGDGRSYRIILAIPLLMCAHPAFAGPLSFDCDTPPDHFSSVSGNSQTTPSISGTVQLVEMRSGKNLPVAGARLVSADGDDSVGFQLAAANAHAKKFAILLNIKHGSDFRRITLGQLDVSAPIPFSLSLSETGKVALSVAGNSFDADFIPIPAGKAMAFCSTAQFKFAGLAFSEAPSQTDDRR